MKKQDWKKGMNGNFQKKQILTKQYIINVDKNGQLYT